MNLIESFSEFKAGKNIDRPTMVRVMEDVFRTLIKKKYGTDEHFDIIVNNNGDLQLWRVRKIVPDGEVMDEQGQVSLSEAKSIDVSYELDEDCYEELTLEDFGRRAIMAARQTLVSRIMELEKDEVFQRYKDREGEIILGEVQQILKREILILDDATNNELLLPRTEMIRGDYFKKGDMVRAIIKRVEMKNNNPVIIISRTDNMFLAKLMEQEVPEVEDGLITIKKIVRLPGERAKVAVESYDDRIDPVGACVGMKGSRIHGIVRELGNENIDVINYTSNIQLYITRALSPAKVSTVKINEETKRAEVFLKLEEVSKAIGRGGHNIKLAGLLTGYELDVIREGNIADSEDDVELTEFSDEIEAWIIEEFAKIGLDTARSILNQDVNDLVRRTDLEEETILEVM